MKERLRRFHEAADIKIALNVGVLFEDELTEEMKDAQIEFKSYLDRIGERN